MKSPKRMNILLLGIALIVAIVCAAVGINAGDTTKKIRIIYTNDTLGYVEPCG